MNPLPQAVVHDSFGPPEEVLALKPLPASAPGAGEVVVALRAACLNPSDFGMVSGSYGKRKSLPAVAGREGFGEVVRIGGGVTELRAGDRVRMPEETGVLRQALTAKAADLVKIPADADPRHAAMAFVNPPTALRLLEDFADLKPGDWIVQNAANSAVGLCVCGFARARGVKVLAVCRDSERRKAALIEAGATAVAGDNDDYPRSLEELTGGARPRLALNSVGGLSVQRMIKCLADGGVCVTFGGMTGDPVRFPTRYLIFNDIRLRGFWMDRWYRSHDVKDSKALLDIIFAEFKAGVIKVPVAAEYPFEQALEAFAHTARGKREGKILITSDWTDAG